MDIVLDWVKTELQKGAQAYVISPLIEESESLDLKNAIALHEDLSEYFAGCANVALMHGRMKNEEKKLSCKTLKFKRVRFWSQRQ